MICQVMMLMNFYHMTVEFGGSHLVGGGEIKQFRLLD